MTRGVNGAKGEAEAVVGGERRRLCLTLGALAEMETALGVEGFEALAGRLRRLSAGDLTAVLAALLKGGGLDEREAAAVAGTSAPGEAADAVAAAFRAAAG